MRSTIAVLTDAGVANPSINEGAKPGQRRRASERGRLRTLSRRGSGVRIPAPAPSQNSGILHARVPVRAGGWGGPCFLVHNQS